MPKSSFLKYSIAAFSLVFLLGGCLIPPPETWKIVDRDRAIQVLTENSKNIFKVKDFTKIQSKVESIELSPNKAVPVVVYRFNTQRLCGLGGCLHSVYLKSTNRLLFRILLDKQAVITTVDNCLSFSQPSKQGNVGIKYCYQKSQYVQQAITRSGT